MRTRTEIRADIENIGFHLARLDQWTPGTDDEAREKQKRLEKLWARLNELGAEMKGAQP
ncbi:MAG: hypothetical protein KDJ29_03775 [Hyphomicrobiales bacterium]|nr:hypothetical protein [Hyphomicrobiales bacterium]